MYQNRAGTQGVIRGVAGEILRAGAPPYLRDLFPTAADEPRRIAKSQRGRGMEEIAANKKHREIGLLTGNHLRPLLAGMTLQFSCRRATDI